MDHCAEIVNNLLVNAKCFSVEDFISASKLTASRARLKLLELEMEGLINQIGRRFYSAKKTRHPTQFLGVARMLTITNGGYFTSSQFAEVIGIDARSAATQLRKMIVRGQVERVSATKYAYIPQVADSSYEQQNHSPAGGDNFNKNDALLCELARIF